MAAEAVVSSSAVPRPRGTNRPPPDALPDPSVSAAKESDVLASYTMALTRTGTPARSS